MADQTPQSDTSLEASALHSACHPRRAIRADRGGGLRRRGGARGLAHLHVIEVLDELGIRPVAIAGSSIGAIMGAGMAAGMPGRDIRDYTLATVGRRGESLQPPLEPEANDLSQAMTNGFRLGQFNIERILKAFLPEAIPEDFSGLAIPLKVTATDYYGMHEAVFERGPVLPAIAASCAIPAVFMPVKIDGRVMIDGGIYNPIPFDHLRTLADIVIAVDVVGGPMATARRCDPHRQPVRRHAAFDAVDHLHEAE